MGSVGRAQEGKTAKCIVSGKEIAVSESTRFVAVNGEKVYFCCDNCPKAFAANPEKYVTSAGDCPVNKGNGAMPGKEGRVVVNNSLYYFCCASCPDAFAKNPENFVKEMHDAVSGKKFAPKASSPRVEKDGQIYLFSGPETRAAFEKDSARYMLVYK